MLAILIALAGGFLMEIIFKLQYRNYSILQSFNLYLGAAIISILFTEIVFQLNTWLNKIASWKDNPQKRMISQGTMHIAVGLIIYISFRLLYFVTFSTKKFILLSDEFVILIFITGLIIFLNLIDFGAILINQYRHSLAEAEKYKKESAEFEFEMLQAQLNPHFLFNSLNTLSSLVYEDADRSAEFIRKLSDVYRHVLDTRQKELISIEEELSFIKSFVFLLELRFDKKLNIRINVEQGMMDRKIAPLSLQLLIENAVKHNVVSENRPLEIRVYNNSKYIIVENPLQTRIEKSKGNQMGLKNISSRYMALCGEEIIISKEDNKFTVKVPII